MVTIDTQQDADQLTRELLAGRLFAVFLDLDERGYPFTAGELKRLRAVSSFTIERYQAAVKYFESKLKDYL